MADQNEKFIKLVRRINGNRSVKVMENDLDFTSKINHDFPEFSKTCVKILDGKSVDIDKVIGIMNTAGIEIKKHTYGEDFETLIIATDKGNYVHPMVQMGSLEDIPTH